MSMITEIGIVAGEIWHYLDQHQTGSLDELTGHIQKDKNLILMSLGWLAREGHVTLQDPDSGYRVRLTHR